MYGITIIKSVRQKDRQNPLEDCCACWHPLVWLNGFLRRLWFIGEKDVLSVAAIGWFLTVVFQIHAAGVNSSSISIKRTSLNIDEIHAQVGCHGCSNPVCCHMDSTKLVDYLHTIKYYGYIFPISKGNDIPVNSRQCLWKSYCARIQGKQCSKMESVQKGWRKDKEAANTSEWWHIVITSREFQIGKKARLYFTGDAKMRVKTCLAKTFCQRKWQLVTLMAMARLLHHSGWKLRVSESHKSLLFNDRTKAALAESQCQGQDRGIQETKYN